MAEERKKKKTTRKVGYADTGSSDDPFGTGTGSVDESQYDSDDRIEPEISDWGECDDSSDARINE